jgi:hypothetical protein
MDDPTLEQRVSAIEAQLIANVKLTEEIHASMLLTREIHQWVGAAKGFFRVLGWLGTAIKWLAAVTSAIAALWFLLLKGHEK